jgi:hypothetical protein
MYGTLPVMSRGLFPSNAVPATYVKMAGLVPFQLYAPNITMTRRHLDRPSQNLVICPNKLERH